MSKRVCAVVDRIEGETAVLLIQPEGHSIDWPVDELPEGVTEGCCLAILIDVDERGRKQATEEIDKIIRRLRRND